MRPRIGLVDSGCPDAAASAGFVLGEDLRPRRVVPVADALGHGSAIAALIRAAAPGADILDAQVFRETLSTSAAAVAAALDWAVEEGAVVVAMSLGLHGDRAVLREACARAVAAGVLLVASAPARGARTFPAAYDGVLRCTGDARCAPGEVSRLLDGYLFGACPRPPDGAPAVLGGASFAVGHVCGLLAAALADGSLAAPRDAAQWLPAREAAQWLPAREAAQWLPAREAAQWLPAREAAQWLPAREAAQWLAARAVHHGAERRG